MKRISLVLFVIFFCPSVLLASQPIGGWKRDVEVKGAPITVKWTNPKFQPQCVVWMQDYTVEEIHPVFSGSEIRIERKGRNKIPAKLLVVPADSHLQPKILDVSEQTREVVFITEDIPGDEVFFWGITPENPFPPPSGPSAISVSVRLLRNKSIYSEFYGAFLWKIKQDGSQNQVEPFYFSSESLGAISSKGFQRASNIADTLCRIHNGGDCPFVFETTPNSWGKSFQIDFKINPHAQPVFY